MNVPATRVDGVVDGVRTLVITPRRALIGSEGGLNG